MSSSVSDRFNSTLVALTAAAGTGAYALPLVTPWHALLFLVGWLSGAVFTQTRQGTWIWNALCVVTFIAVLAGYLPSPISSATVAAAALCVAGAPLLGAAILLMHLATVATVQDWLADYLFAGGLEVAGPSLVAIAVLMLARPLFAAQALFAVAVSLALAWTANKLALSPAVGMAVASTAACAFAALVARADVPTRRSPAHLPLIGLLFASLLSWSWTPPRAVSEVYILLPTQKNAPEAKFFENYMEALSFAGIEATKVTEPEEVPPRSLLLLPRFTSATGQAENTQLETRIGSLARERQWTVLVAGEHTNLGKIASRIEVASGQSILRDDLTVPPSNSDYSGPLHTSALRAWPHDAILNRGASVRATSLDHRVLLAGDGWWAEPNIGEWLWVGDYIWQPSDRAGRLSLAVSVDVDGSRWVVVGDNSFLLNRNLIADPRPTLQLIELASLWPLLIKDMTIAVLILIIVLPTFVHTWLREWSANACLAALIVAGFLVDVTSNRASAKWQDFYVGQSGLDDRNFNIRLAENAELIRKHQIVRLGGEVSGPVASPPGSSIVFMIVDQNAEIDGVKVDECRRLGSLSTSSGAYLMDAQACRVRGASDILIGSTESAAAFVVVNDDRKTVVVLDRAFLAQRAPDKNAQWLLQHVDNIFN